MADAAANVEAVESIEIETRVIDDEDGYAVEATAVIAD